MNKASSDVGSEKLEGGRHSRPNIRRRDENDSAVDGVVGGGTRATIYVTLRAMMISKMRTSFRVVAFKAFNPNKMSSFAQLQDAQKGRNPLENVRHILGTEGMRGVYIRTMPVLLGNYLNSMVLFGVYAKLCSVPLNVNDEAVVMWKDGSALSSSDRRKVKEDALREVLKAGAMAGGTHGAVSSSLHLYIEKLNREIRTHKPEPSIWPAFRSKQAQRRILKITAIDAAAYSVFFGGFELGKQLWLPPIKAWVDRQHWIADKPLAMISFTALAAGGAAGVGYSGVKFPSMWAIHGKPLATTAFAKEFVGSTLKSVAPNACTFLVLEVILYKLGLH